MALLLLAQAALADEGAAAPHLPATLRTIAQDEGAACLDGCAPGYWVMPGDPSRFYIHMEGGGWCISLEDCANRARTATGTSKFNQQVSDLQGMVDGWGAWVSCEPAGLAELPGQWAGLSWGRAVARSTSPTPRR